MFRAYIAALCFQFGWIILKTVPHVRSRRIIMSYFGSFGPGSDIVMYGSSKPTTDQEIFRDPLLVSKFVSLWACQSVSECATTDVLL